MTGLFIAYLLKLPLESQMRELYGVSQNGWQTGSVSVLAVLLIEGIILLSIGHSLKKTEKLSVLEAMFPKQKEEKRKSCGQYLFIGFVAAICAFLMLVPQNLYSTLSSPKFVTYMGIGDGEIRIDVRQTEDILQTTAQVAAELEKDERVEKYAVLQTKNCPAFLADGTTCNLTVEMGDHTKFPVSYVEGTVPGKETELALSVLNAKELGLDVGDSLQLLIGSRKITCTVCGIYSDITNGGITAKTGMACGGQETDADIACSEQEAEADIAESGKTTTAGITESTAYCEEDDVPVMWSILYVSLKPSVCREQWLEEYSNAGIKAVDIADYVTETYGQTLQQIKLASRVAAGTAVVIIFVVITLFMRLIVEKNRYSVSLKKVLGFTNGSIKKYYMISGLLPAAAGIAVGLFMGSILGENLCGGILKIFGADGFRFVVAWERILFLIPAILLAASGAAAWTGISEIKRVKAFECCMRKE